MGMEWSRAESNLLPTPSFEVSLSRNERPGDLLWCEAPLVSDSLSCSRSLILRSRYSSCDGASVSVFERPVGCACESAAAPAPAPADSGIVICFAPANAVRAELMPLPLADVEVDVTPEANELDGLP